jgi:mRNA interferase RelE/StbE
VNYRIELIPEAEKSLAGLALKQRQRIARKIDALAANPRPPGAKKLKGPDPPIYRLSSGDFRILYQVHDEQSRVLVVRIGDRKSVYRRLPD